MQDKRQRRPPMGVAPLLATCFGVGLLPRAPGTWGSILGVPMAFWIYNFSHSELVCCRLSGYGNLSAYICTALGLLILSLFAWLVIGFTEKSWKTHDDGRIVIDEVVGQAFALAFFYPSFWTVISGFVLFRLLDIFKPGPIGWVDRNLQSAWGTLLDDILAGIVAAGVLALVQILQPVIN